MAFKGLKFLILLYAVFDLANAWTYSEQDQWSAEYPTCGSNQQSPIAINSMEAGAKTHPPIKYDNYKQPFNVIITNNGHSAEIKMPEDAVKPRISGGPLPADETYQFENLHFHWGANNSLGSEHVLNNRRYPMEVHAVHYNTKYANLEEAIQHSDGVTVVTAFYQINSFQRLAALQNVSYALSAIIEYETTTKIANFKLSGMYGGIDTTSKRVYYTYAGSLTTPPCSEAVTWIIFPNPVSVTSNQLKPFRKLRDEHGGILVNNFRQLHNLNGRKIYLNRPGQKEPRIDEDI
ncbi:putative carbonic anhydrase 3 [Stomoxys calcitrans]|uniref:putative carbonic anhydrase 3 n=1 Tax=Stomoxys calcitrans TaxID=35570 RepID=UPI0027E23CC2|nr:putative carbonic anhydrase 3 [Stomoxys calcitrans]